jgi:hypothetical protein
MPRRAPFRTLRRTPAQGRALTNRRPLIYREGRGAQDEKRGFQRLVNVLSDEFIQLSEGQEVPGVPAIVRKCDLQGRRQQELGGQ